VIVYLLFATRTVSPHTHGSSLITLGGFARSQVFESAS
jgi:hypothetical protein